MQPVSLRGHVQVLQCRGLHLRALRRRAAQHLRALSKGAADAPRQNVARSNGFNSKGLRPRGGRHDGSGNGARDRGTRNGRSGRTAMQPQSLRGHLPVLSCRGLHLSAPGRRSSPPLRAISRRSPPTRRWHGIHPGSRPGWSLAGMAASNFDRFRRKQMPNVAPHQLKAKSQPRPAPRVLLFDNWNKSCTNPDCPSPMIGPRSDRDRIKQEEQETPRRRPGRGRRARRATPPPRDRRRGDTVTLGDHWES